MKIKKLLDNITGKEYNKNNKTTKIVKGESAMEIKLAKEEQIVKSWDYAIDGNAFSKSRKKFRHNLTATNKRIIWTSYNDVKICRREIPTSDVNFIESDFGQNRKFWAIIRLIFGIPLCLALIGIPIVLNALAVIRGSSFYLSLMTSKRSGEGIELGKISGAMNKPGLFKRFLHWAFGAFKVTVSKTNALEIMNELGAIILDVKRENGK